MWKQNNCGQVLWHMMTMPMVNRCDQDDTTCQTGFTFWILFKLSVREVSQTVWPPRKGKWKYEPMEKEKKNVDPWKRKMEIQTYGKGKYGPMEKENGNADLWKRKRKIWIHGKGKWKYGPMEKGRRRATRCLLMRWRWRASISILASSPREQGEEGGAGVLPARSERYYQIVFFLFSGEQDNQSNFGWES